MAMRAKFKSIGKTVLGLKQSRHMDDAEAFRARTQSLDALGTGSCQEEEQVRASSDRSLCSESSLGSSQQDGGSIKHDVNRKDVIPTSRFARRSFSLPVATKGTSPIIHDVERSKENPSSKIGALEVLFFVSCPCVLRKLWLNMSA